MKKLQSTLLNMLMSLVGICLVVSALLGLMYQVTLKPIAETNKAQEEAAIKEVVPGFDKKEEKKANINGEEITYYVATKGGDVLGYAVKSFSNNGFSGHISVMVGFDKDGKLNNYKVLEQAETPGLGAKMQDWFHSGKTQEESASDFQKFENVTISEPLKVTKDGGTVNAITAATISSRAFLDAVNRAHEVFEYAKSNEGGK